MDPVTLATLVVALVVVIMTVSVLRGIQDVRSRLRHLSGMVRSSEVAIRGQAEELADLRSAVSKIAPSNQKEPKGPLEIVGGDPISAAAGSILGEAIRTTGLELAEGSSVRFRDPVAGDDRGTEEDGLRQHASADATPERTPTEAPTLSLSERRFMIEAEAPSAAAVPLPVQDPVELTGLIREVSPPAGPPAAEEVAPVEVHFDDSGTSLPGSASPQSASPFTGMPTEVNSHAAARQRRAEILSAISNPKTSPDTLLDLYRELRSLNREHRAWESGRLPPARVRLR